ncbi:hypothetical protein OCAR_4454 [Afipia carboxidovorans OM5]|nr:hypothetical protein OCAR_4454 [Afipia carboxidovorans OM5]
MAHGPVCRFGNVQAALISRAGQNLIPRNKPCWRRGFQMTQRLRREPDIRLCAAQKIVGENSC